MDLRERYQKKANSLLSRLDEEFPSDFATVSQGKGKPFTQQELRDHGLASIAEPGEYEKYLEFMNDDGPPYDDSEEEVTKDTMMHCIPCGWEGKKSELIDGKKCPECGSTNVVTMDKWKKMNKGKSEEEVRAAQDYPEPNGED